MSLNIIIAFGNRKIDIKVKRSDTKINVSISSDDNLLKSLLIRNGEKINIHLPE